MVPGSIPGAALLPLGGEVVGLEWCAMAPNTSYLAHFFRTKIDFLLQMSKMMVRKKGDLNVLHKKKWRVMKLRALIDEIVEVKEDLGVGESELTSEMGAGSPSTLGLKGQSCCVEFFLIFFFFCG